jgi:hypothetical protein
MGILNRDGHHIDASQPSVTDSRTATHGSAESTSAVTLDLPLAAEIVTRLY